MAPYSEFPEEVKSLLLSEKYFFFLDLAPHFPNVYIIFTSPRFYFVFCHAQQVNFLLQTEIIPLCLRIMETGSELYMFLNYFTFFMRLA